MIAELGHYALMLALGLALIQGTMPIVGARSNDAALMAMAIPAALVQFAFVALAFGALTACYVTSDFSVLNVYENSNSGMPLLYRLTSVWGNHEGSMMLWVLILTFFGALVAAFGNNLPVRLKANALGVQAWIAAAFYLFILVTSNPFLRIADAPFEGRDLNPVLQDPGLAFHPPLLYLGYVGFSIAFSFAIAALLEGRIDAAWARWVRPWVLVAWMCLTLGIAGGSYWAYYELGWGGFWFWDPVENASLMPWLAGTALLHSAVVMEKRGALKVWTILLAIVAFSLSLIGTFLVRSGVLTSVHAFATDPARGIFILAILILFIGGALALFAWRAPLLKQGGLFAPVSREGALVLNNLFLTAACVTVFVGTLYPLALEALTGEKISVGPPFFNATFAPLFVPLLLAMPFGPLLGWKRARPARRGPAPARRRDACRHRYRRGLRAAAWRSGSCAIRCGSCDLRHGWRADRHRRTHHDSAGATRGRAAPRGGIAAFGLGHRVRPFRHRLFADGHCRRDGVGQRTHWRAQAGRNHRHRALPADVRGTVQPPRTELSRHGRALHRAPRQRRSDRHDATRPAYFPEPQHGDHGSGADDAQAQSGLPVDGRSGNRWQRAGAGVFQAAGADDLARRTDHVYRRRAVAFGPAPAYRRAAPRESAGCPAGRRVSVVAASRRRLPRAAFLAAFLLLLCAASPLRAVESKEMLPDPALEARARALSKELRCMVCQNQSIDDSEAPLAHDLRVLVRDRLKAGDSDTQVLDYLVARYGEFVLLRPRVTWHNAALWGIPPLVLLAGIVTIIVVAGRRRNLPAGEPANLSAAEETRLTEILRDES